MIFKPSYKLKACGFPSTTAFRTLSMISSLTHFHSISLSMKFHESLKYSKQGPCLKKDTFYSKKLSRVVRVDVGLLVTGLDTFFLLAFMASGLISDKGDWCTAVTEILLKTFKELLNKNNLMTLQYNYFNLEYKDTGWINLALPPSPSYPVLTW